ncbi:hypothetical protein [Rhodopila sp.]|uniref:hypothetical protein n=1 Tax=Rhodopila sp. TaxID=2480087 RepID=UPI003D0BEDDE
MGNWQRSFSCTGFAAKTSSANKQCPGQAKSRGEPSTQARNAAETTSRIQAIGIICRAQHQNIREFRHFAVGTLYAAAHRDAAR